MEGILNFAFEHKNLNYSAHWSLKIIKQNIE